MASQPDSNPDSVPTGPSDDVERVSPAPGRDSSPDDVERVAPDPGHDADADPAPDSPGEDGGTSGTGGTNHRVDRDITS